MKRSHCPYGHFCSGTLLNTYHKNTISADTVSTRNHNIQKLDFSKWIPPAGELVGASNKNSQLHLYGENMAVRQFLA